MPQYQYRYRRPQRRRIRIRWILIALVLVMMVGYPFVEPLTLSIEEHTLQVTGLPNNLKNLRIVYATDIHQCAWFSQKRVDFDKIKRKSA